MKLSDHICRALCQVLGDEEFKPLHAPTFAGNEWRYVKETLDSTFVSSVGEYVDRFEEMLAGYAGAKRAVAVVNGTAALHVALLLADVSYGSEVLIPTLTFVATANAISYIGAIPHFVDSNYSSLGIDAAKLNDYLQDIVLMQNGVAINRVTGRAISAMVPMHTFGHPVDMEPLIEIGQKFNVPLIEDAAESLGSFYKGVHTGNFGKLGTLSFNGNKTITTGGGGAILTNDEVMADKAKYLTTTAKRPHKWEYFHDQIGYNYRLPNINAALGCAQMEELPGFIEKKRELAAKYEKTFANMQGVTFFKEPNYAKSNYWLNTLILDQENIISRDEILEATNKAGYMTRPAWVLMHKLPMFADCPKMDLCVAEDLEKRIINIPSSVCCGKKDDQK